MAAQIAPRKFPKTLEEHYRIYRVQIADILEKLCVNVNLYASEKIIDRRLCEHLKESTLSLMDYFIHERTSEGDVKPYGNQKFLMVAAVCFWILMKFSMDDFLDVNGILACCGSIKCTKRDIVEKELNVLDAIRFEVGLFCRPRRFRRQSAPPHVQCKS